MSLLIKDMGYTPPRKPDKVYLVYHFDDDIGSFSHSICVTDKLIELPPHGDLIDRGYAIATACSGRIRALPTTEDREDWIRVEEVRESIKNAPTIIPAEEARE